MIQSTTLAEAISHNGRKGVELERTSDYRKGYLAGYEAGMAVNDSQHWKQFQRGVRTGKQREVARRNRSVEAAIKSLKRILRPAYEDRAGKAHGRGE